MSAPRPVVVSFAASDPTSGAGLQADLLTIASLGAHPASVITAITAQDTHGVQALRALEADLVAAQAHALLADMPAAAFKLGVLGSADNASTIAALLASHPRVPAVIDPVLASGRGDALADAATLETLRERLLPHAMVLTPNSLEARRLAGAAPEADLADCARRLCAAGCRYVLVTGTHEAGPEVVNTLYGASGAVREDRWPRLAGSFHGSGCTLASALAVFLARGLEVREAARRAQDYTWRTLEAGYRPGGGQQVPERFFAAR